MWFVAAIKAGQKTLPLNAISSGHCAGLLASGFFAFARLPKASPQWQLRYIKTIRNNPDCRATELSDLKYLLFGLTLIVLAFVWEVVLLDLSFVRHMAPLAQILLVFIGAIVLGSVGGGYILGWFLRKRELIRSHLGRLPEQ